MKGLDTNILVRYLTQDDPRQAQVATEVIEKAVEENEVMLIQPLVLCELVWVLQSAYGFRKPKIITVLDRIMRTAQFEIPQKDTAWLALHDFHRGRGDFSDCYLGRANEKIGAEYTLTFDKSLEDNRRFKLLRGA
jgi:predicted nucleic-acid-binding protein